MLAGRNKSISHISKFKDNKKRYGQMQTRISFRKNLLEDPYTVLPFIECFV